MKNNITDRAVSNRKIKLLRNIFAETTDEDLMLLTEQSVSQYRLSVKNVQKYPVLN
ncbi:hypothetical protein P7266_0891 [Lactococcus cremoris]|nr:hypothetical protein P7266_0891 [Lactococcus cremoris]